MNRWGVGAVAALVVAVAAAWWWQQSAGGAARVADAAAKAGAAGAPLPTVEVQPVEALALVDAAESVGSLRAHQAVMLKPEIGGRVAAIGFEQGRQVRKGQLMVQLDDRLARAQLAQAQAQAANVSSQLARQRELLAQGFVSASAVEQREAELAVAQAQIALAQAQVARSRILAPFDALAGVRKVDVGDYVKDGAELVALQDLSQWWVDFRVPERDAGRLRQGQRVEVVVDAVGARALPARVEALDAQLDADGRSLLVRARLLESVPGLRPGMFVRARTVLAERAAALVVPEAALVPQGGEQFLVRVVDGPDGPVAQRLAARTGARLDGKVEILAGLRAGDLVVVAGQARLLKGGAQPVRIVQVGAQGVQAVDLGTARLPAASAAVPAAAPRPAKQPG